MKKIKDFIKTKLNKKTKIILVLSIFFILSITIISTNSNFRKILAEISGTETPANEAFDDMNFYECVVDAYNNSTKPSNMYYRNYNESLTDEELNVIRILSCPFFKTNKKISSVKGIEKLKSLESADFENNNISYIDVSNNLNLNYLRLSYNNIDSIDLSSNNKLEHLNLTSTNINSINLASNVSLKYLWLDSTNISSLDISNNVNLLMISLVHVGLNYIDVTHNAHLKSLTYIDKNTNDSPSSKISKINLSNNTELNTLILNFTDITTIDLRNNTKISYLNLNNNKKLEYVDLSNLNLLHNLYLYDTVLSQIDLSNNKELTTCSLYFYGENINFEKNLKIETLSLAAPNLKSFDISSLGSLKTLALENVNITSIGMLDLSSNVMLSSLKLNYSSIDLEVDNQYDINDFIKFPDGSNISYDIPYSNYAYANNNIIFSRRIGETYLNIYGTINTSIINTNIIINVTNKDYKVTSKKYTVDEKNKYIFTKTDIDATTIKDNLTKDPEVTLDVISEENDEGNDNTNNILNLLVNNEVVKQYKIVHYTSSKYILNSNYILVKNNIDLGKISCSYGSIDPEESNSKLVFTYFDASNAWDLVDAKVTGYKTVEFEIPTGEGYDGIIYTKTDKTEALINDKIHVPEQVDVEYAYNENKLDSLVLKDKNANNSFKKTYAIVYTESKNYNLLKEYIYLGVDKFIDDIELSKNFLKKEVEGDKLLIKYQNDILDTKYFIKISSDIYKVSNEYVYISDKELDEHSLTISNGKATPNGDKIDLYYNFSEENEYITSLKIASVKFKYNISDGYVYLKNKLSDMIISTKHNNTGIEFDGKDTITIKYRPNEESEELTDELETIKLIYFLTNTYEIEDDQYIFLGNDELDLGKFSTYNCELEEDNNKLIVNYKGQTDRLYLVKIKSNKYTIDDEKYTIKTNSKTFDKNNIDYTNSEVEYKEGYLYVYYDGIHKKYKVINNNDSKTTTTNASKNASNTSTTKAIASSKKTSKNTSESPISTSNNSTTAITTEKQTTKALATTTTVQKIKKKKKSYFWWIIILIILIISLIIGKIIYDKKKREI